MKHTQKWLDAHKATQTSSATGSVNGYTQAQWAAAKAGLPPLYTGADAALNDQPFDSVSPGATPNKVTAEIAAESPEGAKYVAQFVDAGILDIG